MCSYDRAVRFLSPRHRTLPKVCANTYYLPELITPGLPGYAPFLSLASRSNVPTSKKDADLPSAADYYPTALGPRVKGGKALWSTEERFKRGVETDGPSPGDYDIRSPREIAEEKKNNPIRGVGKLYQCRVPYTAGESPVTIPHRRNLHGYQINNHGALKANPISFHDLTLGPAFYDTNKRPHVSCDSYKGGQWSRSTSRRQFGAAKEGPGPGTYEVGTKTGPSASQMRDDLIRFYKKQCSKLPRLAEIVENHALREDLPGPGKYNVPYVPEEEKKTKKVHCGFLSSDERFKDSGVEVPSPCDYVIHGTFGRQKPGSIRSTGFLVDAARFQNKHKDNMPGPADYTITTTTKRPSKYATRIVAFDSCAERDMNFTSKDSASFPACNQYYPKLAACNKEACSCTAIFKSRTARMSPDKDNGQPNCTTYTVDAAKRMLHTKTSFRQPCECVGASFDVTNPRFGPIRDMVTSAKDPELPGPADYSPVQVSSYGKKGDNGDWNKAERFETEPDCSPGPATYEIHPRAVHPATRNTFNTTLGPPRVPKPRVWHTRPKKLRWFARRRPGQPPETIIILPEE